MKLRDDRVSRHSPEPASLGFGLNGDPTSMDRSDQPLPTSRWIEAIRNSLASENVPNSTADFVIDYFAALEFDDVWLPDKVLVLGDGGPIALAFVCLGRSVNFIFRAPLDMRVTRDDTFYPLCNQQTDWARPVALLEEGRAALKALYGSWLTSPEEDSLRFWEFDAPGEWDAHPVRPARRKT